MSEEAAQNLELTEVDVPTLGDLGSVEVWQCGSVATGSHFHTGSVRPQARTDFPGAIASHRFGQQAGATKLAETRQDGSQVLNA